MTSGPPPNPQRDLLVLERTAPGVHERVTDRTWWGHDALFGGYVEALAIGAMRAELDDPTMAAASASTHFFRPFLDGSFRAEVTVERRGRTMANVHARLFSQDRLAGQAIATFARRRTPAEFLALEPPAGLAHPIGSEEPPTDSTLPIPTHGLFAFHPREGGFRMGSGGTEVGGWVRPRFDADVDESLVVMLQDLWLPAAYHHWTEPVVAVSVDITTQFRAALPAPDLRADDGLYVTVRTAGSLGGMVDEDCEVWAPDGRLLLQGRQFRFVQG